jgi:hypothetical protein
MSLQGSPVLRAWDTMQQQALEQVALGLQVWLLVG